MLPRLSILAALVIAGIAFFLPLVAVTVPVWGKLSYSGADAVRAVLERCGGAESTTSDEPRKPGFFDSIKPKVQVPLTGPVILGGGIVLLVLHYLLALPAGTSLLRRRVMTRSLLLWSVLPLGYLILFLVGASITRSDIEAAIAAEAEAGLLSRLLSTVSSQALQTVVIEPGIGSWILAVAGTVTCGILLATWRRPAPQ